MASTTHHHKSPQPVRQMLDAYKNAVWTKDADAFAGLYAAKARIFDTWARWSYDRGTAWRKMATRWFADLGAERVLVEMKEQQAIVTDNIGVAHAFVTYTAVSTDGRKLRAMSNRMTWVLKRTGASWKIVHEHTSVPVDPATLRATLNR
jgi:ketosteroid isomerase-like protein